MKKLSVLIAHRHATSITLEQDFLEAFKSIAAEQKRSINDLVTEIDSLRGDKNLSSAIRLFVLKSLQNKIKYYQDGPFVDNA